MSNILKEFRGFKIPEIEADSILKLEEISTKKFLPIDKDFFPMHLNYERVV